MPYYRFKDNEIFHNTIKAHPKVKFDIVDSRVYYNNLNIQAGSFTDNVTNVPVGYLNFHELNIDRPSDSLIFPFIIKDGGFKTLKGATGGETGTDYNLFDLGAVIDGVYPLSASISRERFEASETALTGSHIVALKNTLDYYTSLSPHYAYSAPWGEWVKEKQKLTLMYIPSIFYGTKIRKGTVNLKYYISGSLIGHLQDKYYNGELIQVDGALKGMEGSCAGVVLYTEGVVVLTGSWNLSESGSYDLGDTAPELATWITYGAGCHDTGSAGANSSRYIGNTVTNSASFSLEFEGTNYVQTITMFAQANRGDLNYSTNHTFVDYDSFQSKPTITGSTQYTENSEIELQNTVSSSFYDYEEKFKHQTFISKIGIYDQHNHLIAVTNLATPIKKTGDRDFTFKLKLDI